jgi:hypothetical protein
VNPIQTQTQTRTKLRRCRLKRRSLDRCVFITAVPITKLFAGRGGSGNNGGHALRETASVD